MTDDVGKVRAVLSSRREDLDCIRAVLSGQKENYQLLVRKYMNPLYYYVKRSVSSEDAKDITQEVFVKAYQKLGQYDEGYSFFSWLCGIAIHQIQSEKRKQARRKTDPTEVIEVSHKETPEQNVLQKEKKDQIQLAIESLPEQYQRVVTMKIFGELSYAEISRILALSEKEVTNILYRARKLLRKRLSTLQEVIV